MTTMARPGDFRKPFLAGARQGVVEPGIAHPLGATVTPARRQLLRLREARHGHRHPVLLRGGRPHPDAGRDPRPGGPPDRRVLARAPARDRPRAALQLRGTRTVGAARGPALRCHQAPARPVRPRRRRPGRLPAARCRRRRRHGHHDEERRHRHPAVRLGGRRPAQPAVARDHRLRGASRRDDRRSQVRRRGRAARHVCRASSRRSRTSPISG